MKESRKYARKQDSRGSINSLMISKERIIITQYTKIPILMKIKQLAFPNRKLKSLIKAPSIKGDKFKT